MTSAELIAEWMRLRNAAGHVAEYMSHQEMTALHKARNDLAVFEAQNRDALIAVASRAEEAERLLAQADAVIARLADLKEPLVSQRRFIMQAVARHAARQNTEGA